MMFSFRVKPHFPPKTTPEFLLADLLNNLDQLAKNPKEAASKVKSKAKKILFPLSLQEFKTSIFIEFFLLYIQSSLNIYPVIIKQKKPLNIRIFKD